MGFDHNKERQILAKEPPRILAREPPISKRQLIVDIKMNGRIDWPFIHN